MTNLRIYVDTSVVGGCLDSGFADESTAIFAMAARGEITLLLSDLLFQELEDAPRQVREILRTLPDRSFELIETTQPVIELQEQFMRASIVGNSASDDAIHVALAIVHGADLIVSWNFKHLVHVDKIRGFNSVGVRMGYNMVDIRSPKEVVPS